MPRPYRQVSLLAAWLSSTDHKMTGHLYMVTSFGFFLVAGLMAMITRAQLSTPGNHLVSGRPYNKLFTVRGAIVLLLFATPLLVRSRSASASAEAALSRRKGRAASQGGWPGTPPVPRRGCRSRCRGRGRR